MFITFHFFLATLSKYTLVPKNYFSEINTTHVKQKKRFTYDNEGLMQIIKTLVKKNNLYLWPGNNG